MSDPVDGPYFCDFNAGARALPEVLEEFVATERRCPANPSSAHSAGRQARGELERARERIAHAVGVAAEDVVFTSGGTEAANLAVLGLGDPGLPVLMGDLEHAAVWEAAQRRGVVPWEVDSEGRVVPDEPTDEVGVVAIVHAQSEVGALQPVESAAAVASSKGAPLFVDAAQTLGRVSLAGVFGAGAHVALSPHKCGGLRGHGVLVGAGLHGSLRPLMHGGGQELGLRPGTQSPALAAANALAIELAAVSAQARAARMRDNREAFLEGLQTKSAEHQVLTPLAKSVPNTAMLCFSGLDGRNLLPALDLAGVHASHGSACSSGSPRPPRVLHAMGVDDALARSCVRFSFGWEEAPSACHRAGQLVGGVVQRLRKKK